MAKSDYYILDNSDIEDKKLEAARGLYQNGNYDSALKLYLDMINTSYSYQLHYEVGSCYYKLNDFDNAEKYFISSIQLETYKNPSYLYLGNIYFKKQNIEKAIENWITSYSYKPDNETVCLNLATSYFTKDMKFQSMYFYKKFLKYAKDKNTAHYLEIKQNIENFEKIGKNFYQKALVALQMKDNKTAIQALDYAVKNYPGNFDINYLLGKLYLEENKYMQALIYLKQALCIDAKSLDVLERLATVMVSLGDFTGAYCCLKRILPLIINNQKDYLEVIRNLKELETHFDNQSHQGHMHWGEQYYNENNYHLSLYEFENCVIINGNMSDKLDTKINKMRLFLNPEARIIKTCFEKGLTFYSTKDFRQSNKYFTKILRLSEENSSDYKMAKARLVNV